MVLSHQTGVRFPVALPVFNLLTINHLAGGTGSAIPYIIEILDVRTIFVQYARRQSQFDRVGTILRHRFAGYKLKSLPPNSVNIHLGQTRLIYWAQPFSQFSIKLLKFD